MLKSSNSQMITKVSKSSFGEIFFLDDFVKYGSAENIRKVLSRLEQEEVLVRLAQGVYLKPKNVLGLSVFFTFFDSFYQLCFFKTCLSSSS
ncbi:MULTISPECIES: DUF6088 family protein [unclassified Sphingobacterium]|uniref:DUF6088 family protein n=1 Tax=unclassified Sphingobacterium TaxID=2609468 RepID=UPI0010D774E5|nr:MULTISPECIES: DUF6088 family protein [unclassified Sphingobacterium]MCS3557436.1 putative transcriptional regulator of viral defense system [Sphingobacterium sp. JUb21]TCQ96323.1 hypothetical protein EDF66_12225 [Sphingobacterium sp. JUb20]